MSMNLRIADQPGRLSAVVVEPFEGNTPWKIEVPTWTIDEVLGRTNMSHEERRAFVKSKLDVIEKIACAKLAAGDVEERPGHGGPRMWISVNADDFPAI